MRAISLASADELRAVGEYALRRALSAPMPAAKGLWSAAAHAAVGHVCEPLLIWLRSNWLYRLTLRGPVAAGILFHPDDPRPPRLDDAAAYFRGRFRFDGQTVESLRGSIFNRQMPSAAFALHLHGFDWLRHLEAAASDPARNFALRLTQQWLKRYGRYAYPAWRPEVIAERLLNLFAHGWFFLDTADSAWRTKFFVSLRNQAIMLARSLDEAPDGLARLKSAAALAMAGLCLGDSRNTLIGLTRLTFEIERQILPDGGHVSRSPEHLAEAARVLVMVERTLSAAGHGVQPVLTGALDRMGPMMRFFRVGDGALTVSHGGGEANPDVVAELLRRDETAPRPPVHAPSSGYQRITGGRTLVLFDVGRTPAQAFAAEAHAGALSFEMSYGIHRILVNCGASVGRDKDWGRALRATAAHSALTLDDTSSAMVLRDGILSRLLGPLLVGGPDSVETRRSEHEQGMTVEASHDGYARRFGVIHQRSLTVSPRGLKVNGIDRLIPVAGRPRKSHASTYTIRFHLHPDVRQSLSQAGDSVILKLPNGEGWRFRSAGSLSIEDSVYFGGGSARRTEQLVVTGDMREDVVECAWLLEHVGAA
jgi:uncharacterized heparinase superfamily protein